MCIRDSNGFDDVVKQKILDSLHPPVQEQTEGYKPKLDNWQKYMENGEYLRSAEITEEANYNMIDGLKNTAAPKDKKNHQKESVLAKLNEKKEEIARRTGQKMCIRDNTQATQLIFCDLSTPKNDGTFNVYDDVRNKLVERGIPKEEIAFIHEYNTEVRKAELFAKVRAGQVRILMGSTPKLGAGTNVQDRLLALHHLDCPWKPSDLERAPVKAS